MRYKKITFSKLIRKNEFRALIGWRYQALLFLSGILFITFLCFGFSKSAFKEVNKLSNHPFSKWVNLTFSGSSRYSLQQLDKLISEGEAKERFLIRNSDFYGIIGYSFFTRTNELGRVFWARTINPDSPIIEELVSKSNLVRLNYDGRISNNLRKMPQGIIVTRKMLNELGFDKMAVRYLFITKRSDASLVIPVPVIAVVEEVTEGADFICSNIFHCNMMSPLVLSAKHHSTLEILAENIDTLTAIKVKHEIASILEIEEMFNIDDETLEILSDSIYIWRFSVPDEGLAVSRQEKFQLISQSPLLQSIYFGEYFAFNIDTACNYSGHYHDYLAIEFNSLDRIREFSEFIDEEFNLSLNYETLTERENYLFVGNLALAAILMVIILSVFSLALYISETFKNHILKVKKNLGNLMALGASNNSLILLYLKVAFQMLAYAMIIALILAYVSGELFEKYILVKLVVLDKSGNYFSLLNSWLIIFIILIVLIALLMTFFTIKRILKVSPGDLIYDRDSNNKNIHILDRVKLIFQKPLV